MSKGDDTLGVLRPVYWRSLMFVLVIARVLSPCSLSSKLIFCIGILKLGVFSEQSLRRLLVGGVVLLIDVTVELMLGHIFLGGAIDVPRSYESVDVVDEENWLLRHKAEMVCHEKVVKMPWSCKVRVGLNGNLLWEASVLLGRKKGGCVMDTLKFTAMPFGLTNAPAVFIELMSRSKEEYESHVKMIVESLKEGNDVQFILTTWKTEQRGSYHRIGSIAWKKRREGALHGTSRQLRIRCPKQRTRQHKMLGGLDQRVCKELESGSYWLDKVWTSIWRDVRTLAVEEAYTTKYSIHLGADTMLCGFRLTNRWLSMKKDIASCGSKYLAYSEGEVEYQGSSGLLLQPELLE
ncbi:hypothetical protein Tco_0858927 [Tanacetum coccineum]|uniref:Uncharacterized protein n=1 Tax=Tanacetum coccineum TaxID=301880 RepID=A0ABQ5BAP6_9ASTR